MSSLPSRGNSEFDVVPNYFDDQLRSLSEALPVGMFMVDLAGRCVHTNERWRELTGLTVDESFGDGWASAVHPEDRDAVLASWRHFVTSRQELTQEYRLVRPNGEVRLVRSRSGLIRNKSGEATGFVGIDVDITERRQAEVALRESEERYRSIFEATSDGLVLNDPDTGLVVEANPAAYAMHGYSHDEFIGLHPMAFIHPSSHGEFGRYVDVVRRGEIFRTRAIDVRKDGSLFHVEVLGTALLYQGKEHLLGVIRDVTEQVEAYRRLEERVDERTREIERRRQVAEGLRELLAVVNSKRTLEEILDFVLLQAGRLLGSDAESLYLIDEHDPTLLHLQASRNVPAEANTPTLRNGLPPTGLAATRRRPVVVPSMRKLNNQPFAATVDDQIVDRGAYLLVVSPGPASAGNPLQQQRNHTMAEQFESTVVIPLLARDASYGALTLHYRSEHVPSDDELELMAAFAGQAGLVIENARLHAQAGDRLRELEALYRADEQMHRSLRLDEVLQALAAVAAEILGADMSAVLVWNAVGDRLVLGASNGLSPDQASRMSFGAGEGIVGQVAETGQPRVVHDAWQDPEARPRFHGSGGVRAGMHVPIILGERVFGVFAVGYHAPRSFSEGELRRLLSLAQRAGLAIANARLFEQAQQAATLKERQRLARELHDSVSQALYGIALGARTARTFLDRDPPRAAEPLDYVLSLADAGLTEMRALIFELRPESLESEGLVAALTKQAAALRARHGIEIQASLAAEPSISLEAKETLYRIAQEALHNVVKHARATRVHLRLELTPSEIKLEVRDDGLGFDPGGSFPGHLGLHTMRDRASRLGGSLEIQSVPRQGTQVRALLPLRPPTVAVDAAPI